MLQEHKELLLKDLCARLPYGIKFLRESWNFEWDQELSVIEILEDIDKDGYINKTKVYNVEDIKPYLFPLSSMTEEQEKEWLYTLSSDYHITYDTVDWLNKNHFDYRNLIQMKLAIAVTKENNPYKK